MLPLALPPSVVPLLFQSLVGPEVEAALRLAGKKDRGDAITAAEAKAMAEFAKDEGEGEGGGGGVGGKAGSIGSAVTAAEVNRSP